MEEIWITRDQALDLIRQQLNCSEEEAELIFEEFKEVFPNCAKTVSLQ